LVHRIADELGRRAAEIGHDDEATHGDISPLRFVADLVIGFLVGDWKRA
jgi:hypothetical protein